MRAAVAIGYRSANSRSTSRLGIRVKAAAAFRPKGGVYGQSGTGRTPCRRSNGAGVLVLGVTERCRFSFRRDVAARVATMARRPPAAVLLTAVKVKTLMYRLQKQVHGCPVCQQWRCLLTLKLLVLLLLATRRLVWWRIHLRS